MVFMIDRNLLRADLYLLIAKLDTFVQIHHGFACKGLMGNWFNQLASTR